jgi:hypothetical protein
MPDPTPQEQERIVQYVEQHPDSYADDIAEALSLPLWFVSDALRAMIADGTLEDSDA